MLLKVLAQRVFSFAFVSFAKKKKVVASDRSDSDFASPSSLLRYLQDVQ